MRWTWYVSGTSAVIWSKTNFGPTGHHYSRISFMPPVCTVLSASSILKCILEVVFCKYVEHCLRFCLHRLNSFKMVAFQFYLKSQKKRKVGWGWGRQIYCFSKKNPWLRWKCETVFP
jgi:hypothetical protein